MKFIILLFALIFLAAIPSSAQIGVDFKQAPEHANGSAAIVWLHSVQHTNDTILVVRCSIVDSNAAAYISSITYSGTGLARMYSNPNTATTFNSPAGNANNRTDVWGLLAPDTGEHDVIVTLAAVPTNDAVCESESLFDVHQSLTPDASDGTAAVAGAGSTPPQPGGSVTTTAAFDFVMDVGLNTSTTSPSVSPPSSPDYAFSGLFMEGYGSTQLTTAAGTYTVAWSGMTNAWSQTIIALKWDGTEAAPVTYYIAPSGNDSNAGSQLSPWLTREHVTNCQDVILAAPGTYAEANFRVGTDGPVQCISTPNMRSLKCETFDGCKINISSSGAHDSMTVSSSYSAIQGWEVTANSAPSTNGCFEAYPPSTSVQIHHVGFINDICNGAGDGCFFTGWNSTTGVDYIAVAGNICYNGAQDIANCYSGIDMIPLVNSDTAPGTHAYIAYNYSWGNVDPTGCGGGNSDGQGIALDSLEESGYTGQVAIENNISIFNGATGIQNYYSMGAPVYILHNTLYGNQTGYTDSPCGELDVFEAYLTQGAYNLIQTTAATACPYMGPVTYYGIRSLDDAASDIFYNNFIYSASGNNYTGSNAVFTGNLTGASPALRGPVEPPAPSCAAFASVIACAAAMIADFKPTNAAASGYGYEPPTSSNIIDPLFPQWLCHATNLPAGLFQNGCGTGHVIGAGTLLKY